MLTLIGSGPPCVETTAMNEAIERAKEIAQRVLAGHYDPLLAFRELAHLREELPLVSSEVMEVFVAVSSELDGVPIGPERAYWNVEVLRVKDLEAARYRDQVRSEVDEALRKLLEAARH
jgi:hypothetical protein